MLKWVFDRRNARYAVLLLLVIMVVIVIAFLRQVTLPFFLAIFLAYLLDPVIRLITRVKIYHWRVHRGVGVLLVYALIAWGLGASTYYGVPKLVVELNKMGGQLPAMLDKFEQDFVRPLDREISRLFASYAADQEGVPGLPSGNGAGAPTPLIVQPPAAPPSVASQAMKPLFDEYMLVVKRVDDNRFDIIPMKKRAK
ncbi:MAG TPA: AI-2E family transporter, partial [bacterium]